MKVDAGPGKSAPIQCIDDVMAPAATIATILVAPRTVGIHKTYVWPAGYYGCNSVPATEWAWRQASVVTDPGPLAQVDPHISLEPRAGLRCCKGATAQEDVVSTRY